MSRLCHELYRLFSNILYPRVELDKWIHWKIMNLLNLIYVVELIFIYHASLENFSYVSKTICALCIESVKHKSSHFGFWMSFGSFSIFERFHLCYRITFFIFHASLEKFSYVSKTIRVLFVKHNSFFTFSFLNVQLTRAFWKFQHFRTLHF